MCLEILCPNRNGSFFFVVGNEIFDILAADTVAYAFESGLAVAVAFAPGAFSTTVEASSKLERAVGRDVFCLYIVCLISFSVPAPKERFTGHTHTFSYDERSWRR